MKIVLIKLMKNYEFHRIFNSFLLLSFCYQNSEHFLQMLEDDFILYTVFEVLYNK